MYQPSCKVCERGVLVPTKMYRMSGAVVAIGFILLVPSVIGMFPAALVLFALLLQPLGIAVNLSAFSMTIVFAVGILSFVGGLLGWLLIMKKLVLRCSACGATVSAS
jgi:hypothetical protein